MEAFVIAIVFVTGWVIGAESRQVDPEPRVEREAISASEKVDARERSVPICDPDYHLIIQRDLTVPVDQQVAENDH